MTPAAATSVLAQYPAIQVKGLTARAHQGGFSGAALWRVHGLAGPLCLRAWPAAMTPPQLAQIHGWMRSATQAGLTFVPRVWDTHGGQTWADHAGCLWDLTDWMPGQADFHASPRPERLATAGRALARLHTAWHAGAAGTQVCPAILRRQKAWQSWTGLLVRQWRPDFAEAADPVQPWAEAAWRLLPPLVAKLPGQLAPWLQRPLPVQPCVVDPWHDHWLFQGDTVSGLIDYGNAGLDHAAVDLARMLGSLVGGEADRWAAGLAAYRHERPLDSLTEDLARVLDATGTVLAAANWLRWLYWERRPFADRTQVGRRLAAVVGRLEKLTLQA